MYGIVAYGMVVSDGIAWFRGIYSLVGTFHFQRLEQVQRLPDATEYVAALWFGWFGVGPQAVFHV